MAESDVTEEKEAAVANATSTCDKRHCKEMRKEKLPPYLRDRGMKLSKYQRKILSHKRIISYLLYTISNFMICSP